MLLGTRKALNLKNFVHSTTTDKATGIAKKVELLRKHFYAAHSMEAHRFHRLFHNKSFAQVFNLAVKECMGFIYNQMSKIRKVIECLQYSVKQKMCSTMLKLSLVLE